jgi:hypothetical protein
MVSSYQKYLVNYNLYLKTSHNVQRKGKDESIKHRLEGLEDGHVRDKGSVPRESEHEGRDEHVENKDEKLGEHIRLIFGLNNFLKHLLDTDIFFYTECK